MDRNEFIALAKSKYSLDFSKHLNCVCYGPAGPCFAATIHNLYFFFEINASKGDRLIIGNEKFVGQNAIKEKLASIDFMLTTLKT